MHSPHFHQLSGCALCSHGLMSVWFTFGVTGVGESMWLYRMHFAACRSVHMYRV